MARKAPAVQEEDQIEASKETMRRLIDDDEVLIPTNDIDYTVSTGSLLLDVTMGGGVHPSIIRMTGVSEGGKSSCSIEIIKNFLKTVPNSKAVIIPSEGRLKDDMKKRSGVQFVYSPDEWVMGSAFVVHTNIFEKAVSIIRDLVTHNPENIKYVFLIDSMDALIPRGDAEKHDEPNKVSGGALLSSDFLRRMANAISVKGHLVIMISQVRAAIKINQYEKSDPKITNAGGGNALLHYSDWILEFQQRYNDDIIWAGEKGKSDRLGHFCKITFRKSANEKTGVTVGYPIKYGRTAGSSVWIEYEIIDMLLFKWNKAVKKGAWITIDDGLIAEIKKDIKEDMPKQHNGMNQLREYLEANPKITNYLFSRFKNIMT